MWKQRIQNVTRWNKSRTHKLVQCAMMLQAISLKGCGEQDAPESAEQSGDHQVVLTLVILLIIGFCNYVYTHWESFQRPLERLGRKRKRDDAEPEPGLPIAEDVDNGAGVGLGEQASSSDGPRPPPNPPPRGSPPRAPVFSLTRWTRHRDGTHGHRNGSCIGCLDV